MLGKVPEEWDLETDLVSIGSGMGGLSAAITAREYGLDSVVLERSDQVGGVTALSQGQTWVPGNHYAAALGIEDSAESGFRYLQRLAMDYGSTAAMLNLAVHAREAVKYFEEKIGLKMKVIRNCPDYYYGLDNNCVAEGRLIEVEPFKGETLGEWQSKTRLSPHVPYALTTQDIADAGGLASMTKWDYELMGRRLAADERCAGSGLAAYFVKGAIDHAIPFYIETTAEQLISDGERIIGVRCTREGKDFFVKANRGVVIAVSSYERRQDYNQTLAHQLDVQSMVPSTVDGANFRLAGPAGARIAIVPEVSPVGFQVPGEEDSEGLGMWRPAMPVIGMPHIIVVNRKGERFGNESFYRDIYFKIDAIDGATQTHPNFPCWIVLDSQAREKYAIGSVVPGQDWPEGLGHVADTIADLAAMAGIDPEGLVQTIARFNANAEKGVDPDYQRGTHPWSAWMTGDMNHKPNPNLGPLVKAPFYAIQQKRLSPTAIPATGLLTDHHSRVIGWDDRPIEGLYAAGNSVARMETGAMMQSGISNARGMAYGWLAARHAAGDPSDLLHKAAIEMNV